MKILKVVDPLKGVHLCVGGTSSALSEIFFWKNYWNFVNELNVILKVYFSILLSNNNIFTS